MFRIYLISVKVIYILLFLGLLVSFLSVACSQPSPPTATVKPTRIPMFPRTPLPSSTGLDPTAVITKAPESDNNLYINLLDLQDLSIDFWHAWDGELGAEVEKLVEEFNRQNEWGIVVEPQYQDSYDGLFERVTDALEANEPPDVVVSYLYHAQAWNGDGEVTDLSKFMEDPTWGWNEDGEVDFYPVFWEHDLVGEKRFGVPAHRSGRLLFYNTTWARSLGFVAAPRTPEEFAKQVCAAASANRQDGDPENDGTGGWMIALDYPAVLGWLYAYEAQIVRGEPGIEPSGYRLYTPEVEAAFTFLRTLYDDGCAWLPDSELPFDDFANRRGLFAVGSVIDIPAQIEAFTRAGNHDRWTVIPFPSPEGKWTNPVFGPSYQVLAPTIEQQLAGWLLIRWLSLPENQARLVEASAGYPLRASSLIELRQFGNRYPQWLEAVEELNLSAIAEPQYPSWRLVRWTLTDAATQLFRSYFAVDRIPEMILFWEAMTYELHRQINR